MLIEKASKEQLAECARLLALNLAHYRARHGELPLEETLALVDMKRAQRGSGTAPDRRHGDIGWRAGKPL
jgi:hypothetical protein